MMLILTIRTDKPEAEVGVFNDTEQLAYLTWPAHRELSATIHHKLNEVLASQDKKLREVEGVVCFKGPGSFTGLRMGLSVGNALAYSLDIPIVSTMGDDWCESGIQALLDKANERIAVPEYGGEVHTTTPRK
jgi:tRNA threonylcarbamoyladenosine biosynthesis protein TsaB